MDDSRERIEWLKELRKKCTESGTILIFDEIITGLRYPKLGVCNAYGIHPDILLLGKALGNGEKIAAVCGLESLMNGNYFVSGTYHSHIFSLIAAKVCMNLAKFDSKFDLKRLNEDSLIFYKKINAMAKGMFTIEGWGCRGAFKGDYLLFHQEMAKAKILFGPSVFINFESVKLLDEILEVSQIAIDNILKGDLVFTGPVPTDAIAKKARK